MVFSVSSERSFGKFPLFRKNRIISALPIIGKGAGKRAPESSHPTVVIGAGVGGLCCAACLARSGRPVMVIEQHSIPGGYATAFSRGRFCFEVSLHAISIHQNATEEILRNAGVLDRIERVALPEMYRFVSPKYDVVIPQGSPDEYIRILTELFPDEAEGIAGFVNLMVGLATEVDRLHHRGGKIFKPIFPFQYRRMWDVRNKTLGDLLDRNIKKTDLKHILSALWVYYGLPPTRMSGFYYGFATGDYLKNGSFYIKGGSQAMSNAFAAVIEENGGRLIYNTRVEKIQVRNNTVTGVVTDAGDLIDARAVVSNVGAPTTFERMLPEEVIPKRYLRRLRRLRAGLSSFIVWLGLNRDLRGKIQGGDIYVYTGRGPEAEYRASVEGDVENTALAVSIYDNMIEGYSQPGNSTIMLAVLCGYEPWRPFEADYRKGEKNAYREMKKRWTDVLLRRAEEHVIPGLEGMLEICVAATPLTNQRYTGNPHGAIYGFEQSMDNSFMNRLENRTPVGGLYLAGAWTFPGGGYTAVLWSGEKVYRELMEDRII